MNALAHLKKLAHTCVPGAGWLQKKNQKRRLSRRRHTRILQTRLDRLEEKCLSHFTAQLLEKLAPWKSADLPLIRIGGKGDGGYIMVDAFDAVDAAYSFGIGDNVAWDKQIAQRAIPVYMYDHTIDQLPEKHAHFHFFKTGICGRPQRPNMKDITTLIRENNHEGKNLVMKMDIEGCEYAALHAMDAKELLQFSQLTVEAHHLEDLLFDGERHFFIRECLEKILEHMHCVHIHANNCGPVFERNDVRIPTTLELSFIRKDMARNFTKAQELQSELDHPNDPEREEIDVRNLWKQSARTHAGQKKANGASYPL